MGFQIQTLQNILEKRKIPYFFTLADNTLFYDNTEHRKDSDKLIIELNDKFHKSSELKKSLVENKINQMKEAAIKEIKDASIKIAIDSVKKIITTSVDKSKLDGVFQKNLNETKEELKKINS